MQTIGIGELQKNMGILTHLDEALKIVDKRKNKDIAIVYPLQSTKDNPVELMSNKFRQRAKARGIVVEDLKKAKQEAYEMELVQKYGLSN
jgi:hypothetical protein